MSHSHAVRYKCMYMTSEKYIHQDSQFIQDHVAGHFALNLEAIQIQKCVAFCRSSKLEKSQMKTSIMIHDTTDTILTGST